MYQHNVQLKPYTSFQTEAIAKIFCQPKNMAELKKCLADHLNEKKIIIGKGCNILFTQDFDGIVIKPDLTGLREFSDEEDEDNDIYIEAMASEDWDEFVEYCVKEGYAGVENLSLIPGTIGAAPVQNIGAYGAEVKECIREVVALDTETCDIISFSNHECEFSYRNSIFKRTNKYFIISVVFHLKRFFTYIPRYIQLNKELADIDDPTIEDVREAVIRIRKRKLPDHKILPNGGSFFKNPFITKQHADEIMMTYPDLPLYVQSDGKLKTSAAFLIDKAGYKNRREGEVGTYPTQPLIIVNYGTDSGKDILEFARKIRSAVQNEFKIELEPEVRIL